MRGDNADGRRIITGKCSASKDGVPDGTGWQGVTRGDRWVDTVKWKMARFKTRFHTSRI